VSAIIEDFLACRMAGNLVNHSRDRNCNKLNKTAMEKLTEPDEVDNLISFYFMLISNRLRQM